MPEHLEITNNMPRQEITTEQVDQVEDWIKQNNGEVVSRHNPFDGTIHPEKTSITTVWSVGDEPICLTHEYFRFSTVGLRIFYGFKYLGKNLSELEVNMLIASQRHAQQLTELGIVDFSKELNRQ